MNTIVAVMFPPTLCAVLPSMSVSIYIPPPTLTPILIAGTESLGQKAGSVSWASCALLPILGLFP